MLAVGALLTQEAKTAGNRAWAEAVENLCGVSSGAPAGALLRSDWEGLTSGAARGAGEVMGKLGAGGDFPVQVCNTAVEVVGALTRPGGGVAGRIAGATAAAFNNAVGNAVCVGQVAGAVVASVGLLVRSAPVAL